MKKFYFLFLLLLLPSVTSAETVTIDGINYEVDPEAKTTEVTSYGDNTIGEIVIPETITFKNIECKVTSIGSYAFEYYRSLTSITIPNSVTSIGDWAFHGCSALMSITIPNSVTSIANSAFSGCSGLTSVNVEAGNTKYDSRDNCNGIIETESNTLIAGCRNTTIPESVIGIGDNAFNNSGLTSITIPESVKSIGSGSFYGCSGLTSITIPNSVKSIEWGTFYGCSGLTSITIPNSVTSIETNAFGYCSGLTSVTIPNSVTSIGASAFCGCVSLTSIIIPNSVTSIGASAFGSCKNLTSVVLSNSISCIGNQTFFLCHKLAYITIPNSVTSIGNSAFEECYALATEIPNGVTTIGSAAFKECGFRTLTIPNSVTSIGEGAFRECLGLKEVYCLAETVPTTDSGAFSDCPQQLIAYVPAGSVDAYKAVEPWSKLSDVRPIGGYAKYTLTYIVDGEEYKTYELGEGDEITPEPAPSKEGYLFSGWSTIPATMPAEDLTITGSFQLITDEDVITLKDTGKGTWCSIYDLDFTDVEGIKAYTATGYDDVDKTIWLTRVFKVPAGTGIMVKGDPGEHKIPHATVKAVYASFFKGVTGTAVTINETDGDNTNYYMAGGQFKKVNGSTTISPNRAYLQLPTLVFAGTRSIDVIYEDEIDDKTGIHSAATTSDQEPGIYYNLQGQRVHNPKKGLYIKRSTSGRLQGKNGKKVIIK